MNPDDPQFLLALCLLGATLVFGGIIFFGLRYRKKLTAAGLSVSWAELKCKLPETRRGTPSALYGLFQDFSATECGYLVRDESDQEIGKVVFKLARRTGWLEIQCLGETYEASTLNTWRQTVIFQQLGKQTPDCTRRSAGLGNTVFEIAGFGTVERKRGSLWSRGSEVSYGFNGREIGFSWTVGNTQLSPRILSLPATVPLPVQLFILASR